MQEILNTRKTLGSTVEAGKTTIFTMNPLYLELPPETKVRWLMVMNSFIQDQLGDIRKEIRHDTLQAGQNSPPATERTAVPENATKEEKQGIQDPP